MVDRPTVSKALFGNAYLLDVASELRQSRVALTARAIAAQLGIADAVVRPILLRLVAAGIINAVVSSDRSKPYAIIKGKFWTLISDLDRQLPRA